MTLSSHRIADIRRVRVELIDFNIIDLVAPFTRAGLLLVFLHDLRVMRVDDGGDFIMKIIKIFPHIARFMNRFGLIIIRPIVIIDGIWVSRLDLHITAAIISVSVHAETLMIDTLITRLSYISLRCKTWLSM